MKEGEVSGLVFRDRNILNVTGKILVDTGAETTILSDYKQCNKIIQIVLLKCRNLLGAKGKTLQEINGLVNSVILVKNAELEVNYLIIG